MLWQEAERAIYGTIPELTSDWLARAEAALAAAKVPGSAWHRFYLPRHLLPFLGLIALACALPATADANPATAYREGRFEAAETAWRETVTTNPTDWIARHNLALALAQQERWPEAAAHATAAWLQHPRDEATRWNLALTCNRAGYTPTAVAPLLENHPRAEFAGLASPAKWEFVLVAGTCLIALALLLWLLAAYGHLPRGTRWVAWTGLSLGLLLVGFGALGRTTYGIAAHPQAALVWRDGTLYSIPTEAETAQQTTPLPAGTMGAVDKTFLGWSRLTFPNGQTGWVRQDEILLMWR
jgi:tetratricopeptide (TPR) repeat protein